MAMLADIFTAFPRFWPGTFIEASHVRCPTVTRASDFPAFGRGTFIAILSMNREVSHGLRSLGLEINLVSRPGLFSLKLEDTLDASPYSEGLLSATGA